MRKYLLAACAVACIFGVPVLAPVQPVDAQGLCVATVSPQMRALLAQFPAGGPGLRAAIARAVEANPSLADAAVAAARNANPSQKEAIGAGLADAANYYAKCGSDLCRGFEGGIRTAMNCADPGTRVGFLLAEAPTLAQGIPGFNNAGAGTNGAGTNGCVTGQTVSQSKPPGC
jgi:hypothetical protein